MNKQLAAIGLYGGTFDPIHNAHLQVAQTALNRCNLSEVRFIPCQQNVLKNEAPTSSSQHRLAMIKLAIADQPAFKLDARELQSAEPSYMINTIISIQQQIPNPLVLIMQQQQQQQQR